MVTTQTILRRKRNLDERNDAISRMTDAGWKVVKEEPSTLDKDSTIFTFEREDDNLPAPGDEVALTAEHVAEDQKLREFKKCNREIKMFTDDVPDYTDGPDDESPEQK